METNIFVHKITEKRVFLLNADSMNSFMNGLRVINNEKFTSLVTGKRPRRIIYNFLVHN